MLLSDIHLFSIRIPTKPKTLIRYDPSGRLGGSVVESLPSAQGMILESQGWVPRQAPCMEPASLSACVSTSLSLSLSITNK